MYIMHFAASPCHLHYAMPKAMQAMHDSARTEPDGGRAAKFCGQSGGEADGESNPASRTQFQASVVSRLPVTYGYHIASCYVRSGISQIQCIGEIADRSSGCTDTRTDGRRCVRKQPMSSSHRPKRLLPYGFYGFVMPVRAGLSALGESPGRPEPGTNDHFCGTATAIRLPW